MQPVSQAFHNASYDTPRTHLVRLEIMWARTGGVWHDQSNDLMNYTTKVSLGWLGKTNADPTIGTATVVLASETGLYNRGKTTDADIAAAINQAAGWAGIPLRIRHGLVTSVSPYSEYAYEFTGYIASAKENGTAGTVELQVSDANYSLLQKKMSTPMAEMLTTSEWARTLLPSTAIIAATNHIIPWQWMDNETVWDELRESARASQAFFYADSMGFQRLLPYDRILTREEDYATWNFSFLLSATPRLISDEFVTEVDCAYTVRLPGPTADIYSHEDVLTLAPGETVEIDAKYSNAAKTTFSLKKREDYYFVSQGGDDMTDYVSVTTSFFAQRAKISFKNNHGSLNAQLTFLKIRGRTLVASATQSVLSKNPTPSIPFDRRLTVEDSVYHQSESIAMANATRAMERLRFGLYLWDVDVPGLPQIELGDPVIFYPDPISNAGVRGFVIDRRHEYDGKELWGTYTLLERDPQAIYNYFVVNESPFNRDYAYY